MICVLDCPDQDTTDQFRFGGDPTAQIICLQLGDLGLARNAGVATSTGEWIAFLDCDDVWGESWIRDAFMSAQARAGAAVWHPEINLCFGEREDVFFHPDMEDPRGFNLAGLAVANYWTALCFAPRGLLVETPYRAMNLHEGFGFEDWNWNLEVISKGVLHKVVPGAVHAIRTKTHGLNGAALRSDALPISNPLFRNIFFPGT